jgi:hypothetical protein
MTKPAGVASTLVLQAASGQDPVSVIDQFHATLLETWHQMCDERRTALTVVWAPV